jgi:hypothetical protein
LLPCPREPAQRCWTAADAFALRVNIFRRKRCKEETNSSEDELGDLRCHDSHLRAKRRSVSFEYDRDSYNNHHHERRTSLEQWQDVRHARCAPMQRGRRRACCLRASPAGTRWMGRHQHLEQQRRSLCPRCARPAFTTSCHRGHCPLHRCNQGCDMCAAGAAATHKNPQMRLHSQALPPSDTHVSSLLWT